MNEKVHKKTLIYDISYKTFMGEKPLLIRCDRIDGFIKVFDGTRYLVIFDFWLFDEIYKRIRYFISEKSGITNRIY